MTTQHPSWLRQADRVYVQAGERRGRFDGGKVWADDRDNPMRISSPHWHAAFQSYTGDRSDGPVSLVERRCPTVVANYYRHNEYGKRRHEVWGGCHRCKPFGGNGKVYEIVRDVDVTDSWRKVRDATKDVNVNFDHVLESFVWAAAKSPYALRFEIDERECETCEGHGATMEMYVEYVTREMAIDGGDMQLEGQPMEQEVEVGCERCNGTGKLPAESYTVKRKDER